MHGLYSQVYKHVSYFNRSIGRSLSVGGYLLNCKTMKPLGVSLEADHLLDICLSLIIMWMLILYLYDI